MSRGTETKPSLDVEKACTPEQEQRPTRDAGPGNAAAAAQLPTSPPTDASESPTGPLIDNLNSALTDPHTPPSLPRLHGLIAAESAATRAAVYRNNGFWLSSIWQETSVSMQQVRQAVDPLAYVTQLADTDAETRTQFVAHVLQQCPDEGQRLLTDARLRRALLNGLTGLDRVRVLQAVAEPGARVDDPYALLQQAVLSPYTSPAAIREAWNEVAGDTGQMMRVAGDLELRARIEAVDAGLAEQIRWETARALSPAVAADSGASGTGPSVVHVYETAGRPALQALLVLPAANYRVMGTTSVSLAERAVKTFVDDVEARLRHTGLIDTPSVAEGEPTGGLQWLADTYADYSGLTIADTVAHINSFFWAESPVAARLAAWFPTSAGASAAATKQTPWKDRQTAVVRRLATSLHAAKGDDASLARWPEHARTTLQQAATDKTTDALTLHQRVSSALLAVAPAYEAAYGSIEALFQGTSAPQARRTVQEALGLRKNTAQNAIDSVLAAECGAQSPSSSALERQQALVGLSDQARATGLALAVAVGSMDAPSAEAAASEFRESLIEGVSSQALSMDDGLTVVPIISAAYAPHGGDLRNGVAQLENSDRVFRYLGMHSTGAALRQEGDDRSDNVLAAEHRTKSSLLELFEAVANRRAGLAVDFAEKSISSASDLVAIDGTDRSPVHAVSDLYLQTYGIEVSQHIRTLPTSIPQIELAHLFGRRDTPEPKVPDVPTVHRDFFLINGQVPEGIDPNGLSDAGNIEAMTLRHVDHLTDMAEDLDALAMDLMDGLPRFQKAIADITMAGGMPLVRPAFQRQNGATIEFYLHASHARGGLSSTDLQTGLMGLQDHRQSAFAVDVMKYARSDQWSQALVVIEKASAEDRQALLADGASMVALRNEAPPAAWGPVYDALNGELHVADLVADESAWADTAESVGSWLEWLFPADVSAIYGEDEEEVDFDVGAIVAASREDMTLEQAALAGARAAVDGGVDVRLDASLGQGDGRMKADAELAHTLGGRARKQADDTDGLRLRQLGLAGSADANVVDNDYWKADNLRNAIAGMSDAERAMAATDAVFLDRIDRLTRDDPDHGTQLYDLLYSGKDGAEAARIDAYGTGTDGAWQGQGFEVVKALAGLSTQERAAIALDEARREEWLRAARTDSGAEVEAARLLDTATTLAGVQFDAARSTDDQSPTDWQDDPVARAAYAEYVAVGTARFRAAMATKDPLGESIVVAQGLREAALDIQAGTTQESRTGFPITEAMTEIWLNVATELQSYGSKLLTDNQDRQAAIADGSEPTVEIDAFSRGHTYDEEQILADLRRWYAEDSGDIEMDSFRAAASSKDVDEMVRLVKAMPIRKVARKLTNLIEMGLHGEPSLQSVYLPFKRADAALAEVEECDADYHQLLARQQLARSEVELHPINVSRGANLQVTNSTSSYHSLDAFKAHQQDQITGAIRARFKDMTPELVGDMLRAEDEHVQLLWNPSRVASASVRATRDLADRSLSAGSWGAEYLTNTDDQAATDYSLLAHGYQRAIAQEDMSDADLERLTRLEGEFRVSMGEFIAAKQKVAKVVSGVTSAAIGAVITAVTAGSGAPIAAALVSTALAGGASIVIHEGILRDDYDAQEASAELGVELLKTALTAHFSKFWEAGKASMHASMLASPKGRELLSAYSALQRVGTEALGPLGMSLAGTAVDTATEDISEVAWKMLDPSMYQHGFATAMSDGLAELEAKIKGLGPSTLRAMLSEIAKEAGKRAVADSASGSGPNARSLGAALPEAPDPDTEPKAFLEYLRKQLAKVPGEMWSETVETGVTGLVNTAVSEGEEYLLTGDDQVDVQRTIGVFQAAGLAGLKKGRDGALGAGIGAYKEHRDATAAHERAPGHQARMRELDALAPDLTPTERELLREWSRNNDFDPINDQAGTFEGDNVDQQVRDVTRAAAEQDLATFRRQVLQPIEDQLAKHETTWGADQSQEDREAYREWILASSSGIDSRLSVTPTDYVRRRDAAREQVVAAKTTDGYRSLSAQEQAWFDHAAAHPTAIADLTTDSVRLQIQVSTPEQASTFKRQLQAVQQEVATSVLTDMLPGMDPAQREWAEANAETLTAGLVMSPSNLAANQETVRQQVQAQYASAQDAAVLQRVAGAENSP